jgi:hypothetical protein
MFYAVIRDKHLTINKDAILVFETMIVNEGEHYDPYDGVFVAPQKGVYLFWWTVSGNGVNTLLLNWLSFGIEDCSLLNGKGRSRLDKNDWNIV